MTSSRPAVRVDAGASRAGSAAGAVPPSAVEAGTAWILRAAIVATALARLIGGDPVYALFCLGGVVLAFAPAVLARSARMTAPIEVELALLFALVADMTLGRELGLYDAMHWYDKALHLGTSVVLGVLAFQAVYVAHFVGHGRRHPWIDGAAILLVTLGLGALWEIGEYGADMLFGRATQGAPLLAPLDDTMVDLVLDGVGGVVGAVVGPVYMRVSRRSRARVRQFASLVEQRERRASRAQRRRRGHGHRARTAALG